MLDVKGVVEMEKGCEDEKDLLSWVGVERHHSQTRKMRGSHNDPLNVQRTDRRNDDVIFNQ